MNLFRVFRPVTFILLAVMVLTISGVLDGEHSFVAAADKPGEEQGKARDNRKETGTGRGEVKESTAPKESKEEKEPKEEKEEKHAGGGGGGASQPNSDGEKEAASDQQQPLASATPGTNVAISHILVDDPCRVSGIVSFSGPYTGRVTLGLTYHVTGSNEFSPTGATWSGDFDGQATEMFVLSPGPPSGLEVAPDRRVNSYRVEVFSASPVPHNMTEKSDSFHCEEGAVEPGPTLTPTPTVEPGSTLTPTPTVEPPAPPTATPVDTPVPSSSSTPTPTSTPGAPPSHTPVSTSTPSPSPTVTPTSTSTAQPSTTPGVTPSPTPTSTAIKTPGGATKIGPDNSGSADPGATAVYVHTVHNLGSTPDVKEITAISSQGWPVALFAGDGTTPLIDTNQSGSLDTGPIGAGQSREIVVKVMVPPGAMRGTTDVTTATARSAGGPAASNSGTATDTTIVNGVVTISLSTSTVDFGRISPLGAVESGVVDVWSSVDDLGAYYVKDRSVQVTVSSNSAWIGAVWAHENTGDASSIRISDGDLQWRLEGDPNWTALNLSSSTFLEGTPGSNSYWHAYRLRVLWEDDAGSFRSIVVYDVTQ